MTSPAGEGVPAPGQRTSRVGRDPAERADEICARRRGRELGLTLVATAQMYGEAEAERIAGVAIGGRRDQVRVVGNARSCVSWSFAPFASDPSRAPRPRLADAT